MFGRALRKDLSRCVSVMLTFFREEWEMEGLQTVGILLILCSSLKLLHFLGLIDFSAGGKTPLRVGTSRPAEPLTFVLLCSVVETNRRKFWWQFTVIGFSGVHWKGRTFGNNRALSTNQNDNIKDSQNCLEKQNISVDLRLPVWLQFYMLFMFSHQCERGTTWCWLSSDTMSKLY